MPGAVVAVRTAGPDRSTIPTELRCDHFVDPLLVERLRSPTRPAIADPYLEVGDPHAMGIGDADCRAPRRVARSLSLVGTAVNRRRQGLLPQQGRATATRQPSEAVVQSLRQL